MINYITKSPHRRGRGEHRADRDGDPVALQLDRLESHRRDHGQEGSRGLPAVGRHGSPGRCTTTPGEIWNTSTATAPTWTPRPMRSRPSWGTISARINAQRLQVYFNNYDLVGANDYNSLTTRQTVRRASCRGAQRGPQSGPALCQPHPRGQRQLHQTTAPLWRHPHGARLPRERESPQHRRHRSQQAGSATFAPIGNPGRCLRRAQQQGGPSRTYWAKNDFPPRGASTLNFGLRLQQGRYLPVSGPHQPGVAARPALQRPIPAMPRGATT